MALNVDLSQRELLTIQDLKRLGIGFHRTHLSRLAKAGRFPKAIHLSTNRICWDAKEIRDWIATKRQERIAP